MDASSLLAEGCAVFADAEGGTKCAPRTALSAFGCLRARSTPPHAVTRLPGMQPQPGGYDVVIERMAQPTLSR